MNNRHNIMHFISRGRGLFFAAAFLLLLTSCMDDDDNLVSEPVEVAYVSIYHAAPDAPDLDIVVDGRVINRNPFDYASYSGYLNFFTGNRELQFQVADATKVLVDTTFSFEDGKAYSLFAVNTLSDIEALLVVDSAAAPASGKAMVRFINLSPDAPAFDVVATGSETPLFAGKAFKQSTGFQEVDAGTYTFDIQTADAADAVVSTEDLELLPGRYYTIVTSGFVSPPEGNSNSLNVEILD